MNLKDWRFPIGCLVCYVLSLLLSSYGQVHAQPQAGVGVAYNRCLAVTTSDTVDLVPFTQQKLLTGILYVGGAGNVTAVMPDGSTVLFTAPPVGAQLPIAIRRVNATNTTATVMVACYKV